MGDRRVINDHNTGHRTPPSPQTQSKPAPAAAVQEAAGSHQTALHGRHAGHHAPARRPRPPSSRSRRLQLRQRAAARPPFAHRGRTPEKWPKSDLRGTKITTRSDARQQATVGAAAAGRPERSCEEPGARGGGRGGQLTPCGLATNASGRADMTWRQMIAVGVRRVVLARGELDRLEGPGYAAMRTELRRKAKEAARTRDRQATAPQDEAEENDATEEEATRERTTRVGRPRGGRRQAVLGWPGPPCSGVGRRWIPLWLEFSRVPDRSGVPPEARLTPAQGWYSVPRHIMTMYLSAPALVAIVWCVLVSEKSDLWGLVVDSANSMAHSSHGPRRARRRAWARRF